jgi:hypothetical protein
VAAVQWLIMRNFDLRFDGYNVQCRMVR